MPGPTINAVDIFCGAGGLTHGLALAGINVTAGVEIDPTCRYPYEANNSSRFVLGDVADVSGRELREHLGSQGCSLLAGCAPHRQVGTPSNRPALFWNPLADFSRLIGEIQPDLVALFHLPSVVGEPEYSELIDALIDYQVSTAVLDCAQLGIPQHRDVLVVLASKLGQIKPLIPSDPTTKTVRQAIGELPLIDAGQPCIDDPLHVAPVLDSQSLERVRDSSLRLAWDQPSPTIDVDCFDFGRGFGHPSQDRGITLREAALLQTFPTGYRFAENTTDVDIPTIARFIGNAVPIELGAFVGASLIDHVRACTAAV